MMNFLLNYLTNLIFDAIALDKYLWAKQFVGFKPLEIAFEEFNQQIETRKENTNNLELSYKHTYNIVENNGIKTYERAVSGPCLAFILNHEGLVQIGDSLYQINDQIVRYTNIQNALELLKNSSKFVKEYPVTEIKLIEEKSNARFADVDQWGEVPNSPYTSPGLATRKFTWRQFAKSYNTGWGCTFDTGAPTCGFIYIYEVGLALKHERKNWLGNWVAQETDGWSRSSGWLYLSGALNYGQSFSAETPGVNMDIYGIALSGMLVSNVAFGSLGLTATGSISNIEANMQGDPQNRKGQTGLLGINANF
ncbi:hypothetical protein P1X15_05030 [Runella sp. MFBS21]|uniref:hypothetical protein n=1 Tax=Runella sp. MFBS21 TaxID=3034018 RepID=UPI0023F97B4E|nr:hypothetical protein [Runella sp. MFBS21]MDF7816944.1 hypothetical protein [Runella sp. MFBS21]